MTKGSILANTENDTGVVSPPPAPPGSSLRSRGRGSRHDIEGCRDNVYRDGHCVWNGCGSLRAYRANRDYPKELPLCTGHLFEVWKIAQDSANRRNNREPTKTTIVGGELRTVEQPVSQLGWIYFLRVGEHIKAGYASRLLPRLRQYPPTAEFLYAHRGTKAGEKATHSMLYLHRSAGREWYEPHDDVFAYIEQQKARYGPMDDPRIKRKDPLDDYRPLPVRIVRG